MYCACEHYCLVLTGYFSAGEMHGSDSECESLDSGLETGGNSNLEPSEAGFVEVGAVSEDSEADEKRPDSGASAESHLSDYR